MLGNKRAQRFTGSLGSRLLRRDSNSQLRGYESRRHASAASQSLYPWAGQEVVYDARIKTTAAFDACIIYAAGAGCQWVSGKITGSRQFMRAPGELTGSKSGGTGRRTVRPPAYTATACDHSSVPSRPGGGLDATSILRFGGAPKIRRLQSVDSRSSLRVKVCSRRRQSAQ